MKQEVRGRDIICSISLFVVSPYFKQKLQGLYTNALADAKNELGFVFN